MAPSSPSPAQDKDKGTESAPPVSSPNPSHPPRQALTTAPLSVAALLTNLAHDHEGVTTVRLARGSVSAASPSKSGSTATESASTISIDSRPSLQAVHDVGALELLEQDQRPTFIVDLMPGPQRSQRPGLHILYRNPALRQSPSVSGLVLVGQTDSAAASSVGPEFLAFKAWVLGVARTSDFNLPVGPPPAHVYGGIAWSQLTLRRKFRVVSGDLSFPCLPPAMAPALVPAPAPPGFSSGFVGVDASTSTHPIKDVTPIAEEISLDLGAGVVVVGDATVEAVADILANVDDNDVRLKADDNMEVQVEQPEAEAFLVEPRTPALTDYFGPVDRGLRAASDAGLEEMGGCNYKSSGRTHSDEFTRQVFRSQPSIQSFDWTRIPMTAPMDDHIRFARQVDWSATPLGPIEDWPSELRAMANLVMGSPHPVAMYWGPEHTAIYNAAYVELAGGKHPKLMGMSYLDAWSEIWDVIEPVFLNAREHGQATMKREDQLFIMRNGFLEETFFSWSIVPILDADGQVAGLYNPAFEHTRRKVSERWMRLLREINERSAAAKNVASFWPQVLKGFDYNEFDVSFVLLYSVKDDGEGEAEAEVEAEGEGNVPSLHSDCHHTAAAPRLVLEGSLGLPEGHAAAPATAGLRDGIEGFTQFMRQCVLGDGSPVVLDRRSGTLPEHLLDGIQWRGFGDAPTTVVVIPVMPSGVCETVVGFVVLGTNPRRPYDDDHKLFVSLLSRQLTTSMASVMLFEEEIKRGQRAERAAELDRQELSLKLRDKTQEALESEYKFTRMAQFSPVGMFIADPSGSLTYCNDMWWAISRHPRAVGSAMTWMESVVDDDRPRLEAVWRRLLQDKVAITHEFRFKRGRKDGDQFIDTWALMSAYPEKNEDGSLRLIFGCLTDISPQKWAEDFQKRQKEEAVEVRRQQENFIDMTSHEMRNPLSAVLQCADEVSNTVADFRRRRLGPGSAAAAPGTGFFMRELQTVLDACEDAAHTVNICASHQKRIVDDILTLSKLDSKLLAVSPVDAQPVAVLELVFKMFESELNTHDIELRFNTDQSYIDYGVDWVKLDPSRLQQVLINLLTNAIKFTQNSDTRVLTVTLGASKDVSDVEHTFIPLSHGAKTDPMDDEHWGTGELVNIHVSVQDTGSGLDDDEMKLLFQRFSQTSPRTHVQYGGSGLGLFISRMLTELQGGQIGVKSVKGAGSVFKFYIKARRTTRQVTPESECNKGTSTPPLVASRSAAKAASPSSRGAKAHAKVRAPLPAEPALALDVLIVEDNLVNQKVLQKQLRSYGNTTLVANHGGEALEVLQLSRFWAGHERDGMAIDVVLMDLEMPVMDGITCVRHIRQLQRDGIIVRHVPIIAVTAYARPEQISDAKSVGIDDVISKPFRMPDLLPKIQELVAKYKTHDRSLPELAQGADAAIVAPSATTPVAVVPPTK